MHAPPATNTAVDAAAAVWLGRFGERALPADRDALVAVLLDEASPDDANLILDALRAGVSFAQLVDAVGRGRS